MSVPHQEATIDGNFRQAWKAFVPNRSLICDEESELLFWKEIVQHTFNIKTQDEVFNDFFDALWREFEKKECWQWKSEVLETLKTLKSLGIPLAILSNWDSRLRKLLTALEVIDWFEFVIISSEKGYSKPHPQLFEQLEKESGYQPHEILHIGDSIKQDIEPARSRGWNTILVDNTNSMHSSLAQFFPHHFDS